MQKGILILISYDGTQYITASEVAARFCVSRGTCHNNILPHVQAYILPGRRRPVYKLVDIEALSPVRVLDPVEQSCSEVLRPLEDNPNKVHTNGRVESTTVSP